MRWPALLPGGVLAGVLVVALGPALAGCQTGAAAGRTDPAPRPPLEAAPAAPAATPRAPRPHVERAPSPEAYRSVLSSELRQLEGDLPGAVDALREAVLHDPESVYLHVRLGQLQLQIGDVERALESARAALELDEKDLDALRLAANAQRLQGDEAAARRTLQHALKVAPGDRPASTLLAELLIADGKVDEAEAVIEQLMERETGAIDGFLVLGRLFTERGELDRALAYTARALERDPRNTDALELRIDLLHGAGDFAEALVFIKKLARERGDSARIRHRWLSGLLLAGETAEASELETAWLDEDGSESMLLVVSDAHEAAGDKAGSLAVLEKRASPEELRRSDRLGVRLARLRYDAGRFADAADAACQLEGDASDEGWTSYLRALCVRARARAGDTAGAVEALDKAREDLPHAWRLLAEMHRLVRQFPEVVRPKDLDAALAAARKARPHDTDLLDLEVRVLEDRGERREASARLDAALRERPHHAELLMLRARHLERTGQGRAAVQIVERLMERSGRPANDQLNFAAFTAADHGLRLDDAVRWAWRATLKDPLNGYIVDTLGWAQFRAGDAKAALATLQRADQLSPGEPEILLHLSEVLEANGDGDAARARAERAFALVDPLDPVLPRIEGLLERLRRSRRG